MRKNIFIILAFLLTGLPRYSFALPSHSWCVGGGTCEAGYTIVSPGQSCETTKPFTCYGENNLMGVVDCDTCPENYELKTIRTTEGLGCTVEKDVCEFVGTIDPGEDCDALCEDCLPPFQRPIWTNVENHPGYKSSTSTVCNESTNCKCVEQKTYGCANGYYGALPRCMTHVNVGISCSGCTQCPKLGDVEAKTALIPSISSPGGGETITDCFISANTELKDSTGTYVFQSNCFYTE